MSLINNECMYLHVNCDEPQWKLKCAVHNCRSNLNTESQNNCIMYHELPLDQEMLLVWKERCRINAEFDDPTVKVCSSHFNLEDYDCTLNPRQLKPNAIPSQNLIIDRVYEKCVEDTKKSADKNIALKLELEALQTEKKALSEKIKVYDQQIAQRGKAIIKAKLKYEKLRKKCGGNKEHSLLSKVFSGAQIGVLIGKEKIFWSNDDLAMAFTLRHIGNKECYLYLKETLNFPLPALSCVQKWAASK